MDGFRHLKSFALLPCVWKHWHKNDLYKAAESVTASEFCAAQSANWWGGGVILMSGGTDVVV